ncbi:MAG: MFS transporter [Thermoplasmata archaeon]
MAVGNSVGRKRGEKAGDGATRARAMRLILLFGVVSLLGDIVYEGARGVTGPFLLLLGAGAGLVGIIAGSAELLGYGLRVASGLASDRRGARWALTFAGYGLIGAIPLLAVAGAWQAAALLILMERIGKALRSPARDAIMSEAAVRVGTGWGFGVHEALDQLGAILGPLILASFFILRGTAGGAGAADDYRAGLAVLAVPYALMMAVLVATWSSSGVAGRGAPRSPIGGAVEGNRGADAGGDGGRGSGGGGGGSKGGYGGAGGGAVWAGRAAEGAGAPGSLRIFLGFVFLSALGLVSFALVGYHLRAGGVTGDAGVPLVYALAMLVDAFVAPVIGRAYDRLKACGGGAGTGLRILLPLPLMTAAVPLLAFAGGLGGAVAGAALWGAVMGAHETVMRAAVADMAPPERKGSAFGLFHGLYGFGMFAGSSVAGLLYSLSLPLLFVFVLSAAAASFLPLAVILRSARRTSKKSS